MWPDLPASADDVQGMLHPKESFLKDGYPIRRKSSTKCMRDRQDMVTVLGKLAGATL